MIFICQTTQEGQRYVGSRGKAGALELYLTRAITPLRYVAGKWGAVSALIAMVVVVPAVVLWLAAVFLAPNWDVLATTAQFMPAVTLALLVMCLFLGFLLTAVSASTDSPVFAALVWVLCIFFLAGISRFLRFHFGLSFWTVLSPWDAIKRVVEAIAGVAPGADYPLWSAVGALLVFVVIGAVLIKRGVKGVEIVG